MRALISFCVTAEEKLLAGKSKLVEGSFL